MLVGEVGTALSGRVRIGKKGLLGERQGFGVAIRFPCGEGLPWPTEGSPSRCDISRGIRGRLRGQRTPEDNEKDKLKGQSKLL